MDTTVWVIAVYLAIYILATMLVTRLYFGRSWLAHGNTVGDVTGIVGSITGAVLLPLSAVTCYTQFIMVKGEIISRGNATKPCSFPNIAFSSNTTNR